MPLIKTLAKGAAASLIAAMLFSVPAQAAPSSVASDMTAQSARAAISALGGAIDSARSSFLDVNLNRLFAQQAQRGDGERGARRGRGGGERGDRGSGRDGQRGDRGSRRGGQQADRRPQGGQQQADRGSRRGGGARASEQREQRPGVRRSQDESGAQARRAPRRDPRDTGQRAGDAGERRRQVDRQAEADRRAAQAAQQSRGDHRGDRRSGRRDYADRRSGDRYGGDRRSDRRDGGDHRYDGRRDDRRYDGRRGDRHYDGRRNDRRYGDRRHRDHYDDRRHRGGHRGSYRNYGYRHGHGPHRGHGYYCNTHFVFHYFTGFDPIGWYFAIHDGYYAPYGCRTVERVRYRHGRRIVYGAVQCWDDWGYPYIVAGSEYVYRSY